MRGSRVGWVGLASAGLLLLTGCSGPEPQLDEARTRELAMEDAGRKVNGIAAAVARERPHAQSAERYARAAVRVPGTEVLRTGGTEISGGFSLVVRVHGESTAVDTSGEPMVETFRLAVCYRITVEPDSGDDRVDEQSCPDGPPLVMAPVEIPASAQDALRRALSAGASDEQGVRAALAGVDLDPLVTRQVTAEGGAVGVALRAGPYDCLLARVDGERVEVWRPARVQLAPGELSCTADTAVRGLGQRPPH